MNRAHSGAVHYFGAVVINDRSAIVNFNLFNEGREELAQAFAVFRGADYLAHEVGHLVDFDIAGGNGWHLLFLKPYQLSFVLFSQGAQFAHAYSEIGQVWGVLAVQLQDGIQISQLFFGVAQVSNRFCTALGAFLDPFSGQFIQVADDFGNGIAGKDPIHYRIDQPDVELLGRDPAR
ncbi:MAG TPA: hypothetical protein VK149_13325 [Sideroxyarcus sp.]|nr:hypothetical protein [Sideroxyarcus sp.]